jgi:hypothetical protein
LFPTEIEAIMGVCLDSQSADNMSPQELSEVINPSIEKSRQGTNLTGGNTTATPGMINSILKPVSDYTETTLPRQPTLMPSKTVTKAHLQDMDDDKKPAAKIPPHDWVTPLIIETILKMTGTNFGRLIDDAYIIGGGIDVNSHSLWNYQTIHALCVKKYLASLAYKKFGSEGFKGNSIDARRRVYLGAIWLVAEAPLCLQGTTRKTRERLNAGKPVKAVGFGKPVFVETFKQYLSVGLQLFYQQMRAWAKVSPHHDLLGGFVINYSNLYTEPPRIYDRQEPLMFPRIAPPEGTTHCFGRCVMATGEARPKWVSYDKISPTNLWDLPSNVSMLPNHRVGRLLPGGKGITSINKVIRRILNHLQAKGLAYNSTDPAGPLPCQGKPPSWVPKDITKLPSRANERTPIQYELMVMEEIAKDEAKQQSTLTTPPNLTRTSTASINRDPAVDPNHSSTSQTHPRSLGLDDGGMDDDNSVWSKMSKIATLFNSSHSIHIVRIVNVKFIWNKDPIYLI